MDNNTKINKIYSIYCSLIDYESNNKECLLINEIIELLNDLISLIEVRDKTEKMNKTFVANILKKGKQL